MTFVIVIATLIAWSVSRIQDWALDEQIGWGIALIFVTILWRTGD